MNDEFVNSFVGVPYEVNGRDRQGWDCWGVVMAVFQEVRGVRLPDWQVDPLPPGMTDPAASAARITEAVAAGVWLHGRAGRFAAARGPVTAPDIAAEVASAVRAARSEGAR